MVVVEGRFDALVVHALADEFGPSAYQLEVLAASGTLNLAGLANAVRRVEDNEPVIIIADGDGQPDAVQRRIETGLDALHPEAADQTELFVFEPTLEETLGSREVPPWCDRPLIADACRKSCAPHTSAI